MGHYKYRTHVTRNKSKLKIVVGFEDIDTYWKVKKISSDQELKVCSTVVVKTEDCGWFGMHSHILYMNTVVAFKLKIED